MICKKPISRTLAALLIGSMAMAAQAEDRGFFAGGGVGQSFVDEGSYDDEDTAVSLFGGYQFNRYFAVEGGYLDFGEIESSGSGPSLEADTFYLSAVGTLPINDAFAVYAKLGFHDWDAGNGWDAVGDEDSGTDPTYGVGVQYRINDRVALRTEFNRFELDEFDVDAVQLQVRFDF